MTIYLYTVNHSVRRGMNKFVQVYRIENEEAPELIGSDHYNSAAWPGAKSVALQIIAQIDIGAADDCKLYLID